MTKKKTKKEEFEELFEKLSMKDKSSFIKLIKYLNKSNLKK